MASKLCPHVLVPTDDAMRMMEAGSPLIKLVNDFGSASEAHARFPNAILLGRVWEGGEHDATKYYREGWSYQDAARAQVDRQKQQYLANPLIRIWEGPNEQVFGGGDDPENVKAIGWYGHYEAERLRLLNEIGLRGCVGNFATGNPDMPEKDRMAMWRAFLPAVQAAKQYGGILGLHEYSSPWMWYHTGKYQKPNHPKYQGAAADAGKYGWLTLRYRMIYDMLLIPQGLGDVPLVITEFGLDRAGDQPPHVSSGPWKANIDFWKSWDGSSDPIDYWRGPERDPEVYYAEQLIWNDREMQKDPYVLGATIFTLGSYGGTAWEHFDIAGTRTAKHLIEYIRREAKVLNSTVAVARPAPREDARFVADVTIPDGTRFQPGSPFTKTWRVKNTGATEWDERYALVFRDGEKMGGPDRVNLPGRVAPDSEVDISVPLVAPATPGTRVGRWRLQNPGGQTFGFGNSSVTVVICVPAPSAAAAVQASTPGGGGEKNLLINSSFEDGSYYGDETRELAVPSGWTFWYAGSAVQRLPGQTEPFQRPTAVILERTTVAPSARALYFVDRDRSFKISGSLGPTWASISQGISGLKAGARYRFAARVLPDLAAGLTPRKTYPTDPDASEVRLVVECGGQTLETGWKNASEVPFGVFSTLRLDFVPPDRNARVKAEVRARQKAAGGGWVLDRLVLEPV